MVQDAATPDRLPLIRLAAALTGLCVAGALIGAWASSARGGSPVLGALTLVATLPGIGASLLLLASRPARPAGAWAVPVIAGTMVRALVTLGIALGMVVAMTLDKTVFLLTVLGVLLACLAAEVGMVLHMVNARGAGTSHATLEGARS